MKMKRLYMLGVTAAIMVSICGCGSRIPDMTEEERTAISEYAVELLLKYDSNQESRLVDLEVLEEEPEPTSKPVIPPVEQETSGMDEVEDTPVIELGGSDIEAAGDVKTVLGLAESISFSYKDYEIVEEYTDVLNSELTLEAETDKQLLVCNFVLINDGAEKQSVDMLANSMKYVFIIDEEIVNAQVTMLSNDLSTYMGILNTDESEKVVLLAECEAAILNRAETIYLQIQKGDETATIQIK